MSMRIDRSDNRTVNIAINIVTFGSSLLLAFVLSLSCQSPAYDIRGTDNSKEQPIGQAGWDMVPFRTLLRSSRQRQRPSTFLVRCNIVRLSTNTRP